MLWRKSLQDPKTRKLVVFIGIWLVGLSLGFGLLTQFDTQPGLLGNVPGVWPKQEGIHYDHQRPTLLMVLHPFCACSKASLHELSRLMSIVPEKTNTSIIVVGKPDNTLRRDLDALKSVFGVNIVLDPSGDKARQFGLETSGHVILYDQQGQLMFSGGITPSRGHQGDNFGSESIVGLLAQQSSKTFAQPTIASTPVFGCSLFSHSQHRGGRQ